MSATGRTRALADPRALRGKPNECQRHKYSGWRCEGLSLLYDIGDENPGLGVARLTTSMRRFGRYLECIAGLSVRVG